MKHCNITGFVRKIPDLKNISRRKLGKFDLTLQENFEKSSELVSISRITYVLLKKMLSKYPHKFGIRLRWSKHAKKNAHTTEYLKGEGDKGYFHGKKGLKVRELVDSTSFVDGNEYLCLRFLSKHPTKKCYKDEEPGLYERPALVLEQLYEEHEIDSPSRKAKVCFSVSVGHPSTAAYKQRDQSQCRKDEALNHAFTKDGDLFQSSDYLDGVSSHLVSHEIKEESKASTQFHLSKKGKTEISPLFAICSVKISTSCHSNSSFSSFSSSGENVCNPCKMRPYNDDNVSPPIEQEISDLCITLEAPIKNTQGEKVSDLPVSPFLGKGMTHEEGKCLSKSTSPNNSSVMTTGVLPIKNAKKWSSWVERLPTSRFSQVADVTKSAEIPSRNSEQKSSKVDRRPKSSFLQSTKAKGENMQPLQTHQKSLHKREDQRTQTLAEELRKQPSTTKSKTLLLNAERSSAKKAQTNCSVVKPKTISVKESKKEVRKPPSKDVSSFREKKALKEKADLQFAKQFQAHAKQNAGTKRGIVITKYKSQLWLKRAGLFEGIINENVAKESFSSVASTAIVLNKDDYIRYLRKISIGSKIKFQDLLQRLAECPPPERKPKNFKTTIVEAKNDDDSGVGKTVVKTGKKDAMGYIIPLVPCLLYVPARDMDGEAAPQENHRPRGFSK